MELREIPGTDRKYAAGEDGHIYCYSRAKVNAKRPCPFRVAESVGSNGYRFIALIAKETKRSKAVHVLVCEAFHGPKLTPQHIVRHLDGNRENNVPSNLCWGTYAENEADKRRHGKTACGEAHGEVKLTEEAVRIIRASIPYGLWNPVDAAKVFGVSESHIRNIARGRWWKHVK